LWRGQELNVSRVFPKKPKKDEKMDFDRFKELKFRFRKIKYATHLRISLKKKLHL
jgi:hypothetical protein